MIFGVLRDRGASEAAEIRAHYRVLSGKDRRHAMPGRMRARMAMQEQDRWSGPAMTHAQNRLWELDHFEVETIEHGGRMATTAWSSALRCFLAGRNLLVSQAEDVCLLWQRFGHTKTCNEPQKESIHPSARVSRHSEPQAEN